MNRYFETICAFFLFALICCMTMRCKNIGRSEETYFEDYSLIDGKGIKLLSKQEVSTGFLDRTYFEVRYADSSYQEIYPKNVKMDYLSKIKVYKQDSLVVYHIYYTHPKPMESDDLYWAYKDSVLKKYTFGGKLAGTDTIIGSFSIYISDSCTVNWILTSDTSDFINRIWNFDQGQFTVSPEHDTLKVKGTASYTLVVWLKKHKVYR